MATPLKANPDWHNFKFTKSKKGFKGTPEKKALKIPQKQDDFPKGLA